jgi:hypothetical protein
MEGGISKRSDRRQKVKGTAVGTSKELVLVQHNRKRRDVR